MTADGSVTVVGSFLDLPAQRSFLVEADDVVEIEPGRADREMPEVAR